MTDDLAALLDIEQVADALRMSTEPARALLDLQGEAPVATYYGKPLWLSDTVHALVSEVPCAGA